MAIQAGFRDGDYVYTGGDPSVPESWSLDPITKAEPQSTPPETVTTPQTIEPGHQEDGYEFTGGDPSQESNWIEITKEPLLYDTGAPLPAGSGASKEAYLIAKSGNQQKLEQLRAKNAQLRQQVSSFQAKADMLARAKAQVDAGELEPEQFNNMLAQTQQVMPDPQQLMAESKIIQQEGEKLHRKVASFYKQRRDGASFDPATGVYRFGNGRIAVGNLEEATVVERDADELLPETVKREQAPQLQDAAVENLSKEVSGFVSGLVKSAKDREFGAAIGVRSAGQIVGIAGAALRMLKEDVLPSVPRVERQYLDADFNKVQRTELPDGGWTLLRVGDGAERVNIDGKNRFAFKRKDGSGYVLAKPVLTEKDTQSYLAAKTENLAQTIQDEITRNKDTYYVTKQANLMASAATGQVASLVDSIATVLPYWMPGKQSLENTLDEAKTYSQRTGAVMDQYADEFVARFTKEKNSLGATLLKGIYNAPGAAAANLPLIMATMGTGALVGVGGKALGLSRRASQVVSLAVASQPEAILESQTTGDEIYRDAIAKGYSEPEAVELRAAGESKVWMANTLLLGASNFAGTGVVERMLKSRVEQTLGVAAANSGTPLQRFVSYAKNVGAESLQEGLQYGTASAAKENPFSDFTSFGLTAMSNALLTKEGWKETLGAIPSMALMGSGELFFGKQKAQVAPEKRVDLVGATMPEADIAVALPTPAQEDVTTDGINKQQAKEQAIAVVTNMMETATDESIKQELNAVREYVNQDGDLQSLGTVLAGAVIPVTQYGNAGFELGRALSTAHNVIVSANGMNVASDQAVREIARFVEDKIGLLNQEVAAHKTMLREIQTAPADIGHIQTLQSQANAKRLAIEAVAQDTVTEITQAVTPFAESARQTLESRIQLLTEPPSLPVLKLPVKGSGRVLDQDVQAVESFLTEVIGQESMDNLKASGMLTVTDVIPNIGKGYAQTGNWRKKAKRATVSVIQTSTDNILGTTLHEIGVHGGIQEFLGADDWAALKHAIAAEYKAGNQSFVRRWDLVRRVYGKGAQGAGAKGVKYLGFEKFTPSDLLDETIDKYTLDVDIAFEEFLGSMASEITEPQHGVMKRILDMLVSGVRRWLRNEGWKTQHLTEDHIKALILGSFEYMATNAKRIRQDVDKSADHVVWQLSPQTEPEMQKLPITEEIVSRVNKPLIAPLPKDQTSVKARLQNFLQDMATETHRISYTKMLLAPRAFIEMHSERIARLGESVDDFVNRISNFKSDRVKPLQLLQKIAAKQDGSDTVLGLLLGNGTVYKNADGTQGRTWTEGEIKHFFPNATQEIIDAYYAIRKELDKGVSELRQSYEQLASRQIAIAKSKLEGISLDNAIAEIELQKQNVLEVLSNKAYWPLTRFGKYRVEIYGSDPKNPIAVVFTQHRGARGKAEVNAQLPGLALQRSEIAKAIREQQIKVGEHVELPAKPDHLLAGVDDMQSVMATYVQSASKIDPELGKMIELELMNAFNERGSQKQHMLFRQGVAGWDTSALKVFNSYVAQTANAVANNEHSLDMYDKLREFTQEKAGAAYDKRLYDYALGVITSAKNPPFHPVANKILQIGFMKHLGLSLGFAVTNELQVAQTLLPTLSNFYGAKDAVRAVGMSEIIAHKMVELHKFYDTFENISSVQIAALLNRHIGPKTFLKFFNGDQTKAQSASNMVKIVLAHAVRSGSLKAESSLGIEAGKVGGAIDRASRAMSIFAVKTEQSNRINSLVSYAILALKHGSLTFSDTNGWTVAPGQTNPIIIAREAERLNAITNFVRGRGSQPRILTGTGQLSGVAQLAFNYKMFTVSNIYLFHNLGLLNAKQRPGAARKAWAYAKPQLVNATIAAMLGGPKAWIWFHILSLFLPKDWVDELMRMAKQFISKKSAKAAQFALGVNDKDADRIGKRFAFDLEHGALPNMVAGVDMFNNLNANIIQETDNKWEVLGRLMFGATVSDAITIGMKAREGKYQEASKRAIPRFLSPIIDAAKGRMEVPGQDIKLSNTDRVKRAIGLTPTEASRVKASEQEAFNFFVNKRNKVIDAVKYDLKRSAENNDGVRPLNKDIKDAKVKLSKFNYDNAAEFRRFRSQMIAVNKEIDKAIYSISAKRRSRRAAIENAGVEE